MTAAPGADDPFTFERHSVLVTNDDGLSSDGLVALARALVRHGFDVVVAAPDGDMSGASAAIGPVSTHVGLRRETLPGLDVPTFAITAPPAMIVIAGLSGAFGRPPDLVASGVNNGVNLGRAVLHSGTVGAALTAHNLGVTAVAVSVEPGGDWDVAAEHGVRALQESLDRRDATVINVNVPKRATSMSVHELTHLASFGVVTAAALDDRLDFRLVIEAEGFDEPDSDADAVRRGCVSVTRLRSIASSVPEAAVVRLETSTAPAAG